LCQPTQGGVGRIRVAARANRLWVSNAHLPESVVQSHDHRDRAKSDGTEESLQLAALQVADGTLHEIADNWMFLVAPDQRHAPAAFCGEHPPGLRQCARHRVFL
jgi:hypothetical protein